MTETEILLIAVIVLAVINIAVGLFKKFNIKPQLKEIENSLLKSDLTLEKTEKSIMEEFRQNRTETNNIARLNREELTRSLDTFSNRFEKNVKDLNDLLKSKHDEMLNHQSDFSRQSAESGRINREELTNNLKSFEIKFTENTKELNELLRQKFSDFSSQQNE
ncbi:MAG: hypothetical protein PHH93_06775, partial [Prolixibacteraceae bacterium]|nr:hypothetical protein [Prolixibacteraceae bacterium]